MMTRIVCATATAARFLPRLPAIRRNFRDRCVPLARDAAHAAWTSAVFSQVFPGAVRPVRRLPALSWLPLARPAHDDRWPAVGNRPMSRPISATTTSATRESTPGIVTKRASVVAPLAVPADQLLQMIQVVHLGPQQESVVVRHAAAQRPLQLRDLLP